MSNEIRRVDFYVLAAADGDARLRFACRLAEKVYALGQRVHLHAASAAESAELDELLWTFRQGSFLPHEMLRADLPPQSPVTVGHGDVATHRTEVLINLAAEVPDFVEAFPRVAEIVDGNEDDRQLGRERFRRYRGAGWITATHPIGASP